MKNKIHELKQPWEYLIEKQNQVTLKISTNFRALMIELYFSSQDLSVATFG